MDLFEQLLKENKKISKEEIRAKKKITESKSLKGKRKLKEAPDMFGLPTDDELQKELDTEIQSVKDKYSNRVADVKKQREIKNTELQNMDVDKEIKSLVSKYGSRTKSVLTGLKKHMDLVRYMRANNPSIINRQLLKTYRQAGIGTGQSPIVGGGAGAYDVLLVDSRYNSTKLQLVITHYWCHAQMFFDGDEITFNAGSSGVTDAKKSLEKSKPTFIQEFKNTIEICLDTIEKACQESSEENDVNRLEVMGDIDRKIRDSYPELKKERNYGFQSGLRSGHMAYFYPALMPFDDFKNQILSNFNEYRDNLIFGRYSDAKNSYYYFGMEDF